MNTGDKKNVTIPAAEAYGEKRQDMVIEVPRTQFPADLALNVGDRFRGGGEAHAPIFTVMALSGDKVTLDGNHPLAGKDLIFDLELVEIKGGSLIILPE